MADMLAEIVVKYQLLGLLHFGAIVGGLKVNAAAILTHKVERVFGKNEISTALAFDIKKAFDYLTES